MTLKFLFERGWPAFSVSSSLYFLLTALHIQSICCHDCTWIELKANAELEHGEKLLGRKFQKMNSQVHDKKNVYIQSDEANYLYWSKDDYSWSMGNPWPVNYVFIYTFYNASLPAEVPLGHEWFLRTEDGRWWTTDHVFMECTEDPNRQQLIFRRYIWIAVGAVTLIGVIVVILLLVLYRKGKICKKAAGLEHPFGDTEELRHKLSEDE